MPHVDENMDELFRKAADNYMLQEGESNWDEISARFEPAAKPFPAPKKINTKRYILMALLMLMFFIAGDLFHNYTSNPGRAESKIQETETNGQVNTNEKTALLTEGNKESTIEKHNNVNDEAQIIANSKLGKDIVNVQQGTKQLLSNTSSHLNHYPGNSTKYFRQAPDPLVNYIPENIDPVINNHQDNFPNNRNDKTEAVNAVIAEAGIGADGLLKKDSVIKSSPVSKIKIKKHSGLYAGLLAGAAFNSVKQQEMSNPGLDIGVIAGYHINTRFSVETGLIYSRKHYYSDGKYFNMDKVGNSMPPGMQVVSLNGSSRIIEFPVKVKYNFIQKNNKAIYGTAGFSSYLLTNEKNDYTTFLNSSTGNMKSAYKENAGYFAGAINLSAGYEHQLGKRSSVRFEPYVEIPTKGIGVGKLPVASSGVHVLFTIAPH